MENQGQQAAIKVGFENALNDYHPEWATTWPQTKIDLARAFYLAALRDTGIFVNNAFGNVFAGHKTAQDGYNWLSKAATLPQQGGMPSLADQEALFSGQPAATEQPVGQNGVPEVAETQAADDNGFEGEAEQPSEGPPVAGEADAPQAEAVAQVPETTPAAEPGATTEISTNPSDTTAG